MPPAPAHLQDGVIVTGAHSLKGHSILPPTPAASLGAGSLAGKHEKKMPVYTWEEVARHNTEESCWIYLGHKVYDITSWIPKHPGGKTVLLLAAGRDCTDLFDSYHPFTSKPRTMIDAYQIGEIQTTEFPQYAPDATGFYAEVRARVGEYFAQNRLNPKDPLPGLWRLVFMIVTALSMWYIVWSNAVTTSWWVKVPAAIIFGMFQALPLLHTMHDCSHTSFGPSESWWLFFGRLTMDWLAGASLTSWHNQHVIGHHVYTNVLGADPDLPLTVEGDIRRVSRLQKWAQHYKFQHIYLFVLYGVLGMKFRIQDLTETLWKQTNGPIRVNLPQAEYYRQVLSKPFWAFWRIYVPLYIFGVSASEYWAMFFIAEFCTGYYLAFNFQVSHVSPSVAFPEITSGFHDDWARAQVKTTVDYAHGNPIMTFLCGALNYQTVHHLFPSVSQYHYPAIAPIVMDVCTKHKVPYTHVPTFYQAFCLHWEHLKQLGNEGHLHAN